MCLVFVAYRLQPAYPLVVAANRDEYYARPSAPAALWADAEHVLAGRDLLGGGTWLGVTRAGRFAALTNHRSGEHREDAPSRGALVSEYLRGDAPAREYLEAVAGEGARYNGFNLLVGDAGGLGWYSNRGPGVVMLGAGLYGLSNHLLDTPWPKVEWGKRRLAALLAGGCWSAEDLLALLADRDVPPDDRLPRTGVGLERERMLAPMFITGPDYGTRSSTVLAVGADGRIALTERTFAPHTLAPSTVAFSLHAGYPPRVGRSRRGSFETRSTGEASR